MNNYKFPVLSDPQNTLREWSITLSKFTEEVKGMFVTPSTWDTSPVFSTTNFSSIDTLLTNYCVINGFCFFTVGFSVSTTASPAFSFSFKLPIKTSESGIALAHGFAEPKFPSGSAANTTFAVAGGGDTMLVERVDKNLFTASSTRTVYVLGFYQVA